jgi:hypothetical protein
MNPILPTEICGQICTFTASPFCKEGTLDEKYKNVMDGESATLRHITIWDSVYSQRDIPRKI